MLKSLFFLYSSVLCWAVLWLLYSIFFLDIFYALNVVSLRRLDVHCKITQKTSCLVSCYLFWLTSKLTVLA